MQLQQMKIGREEANLRLAELRRATNEGAAIREAMGAGVTSQPTTLGVAPVAGRLLPPQQRLRFDRQATLSALAQGSAPYLMPEVEAGFAGQEAKEREALMKLAKDAENLTTEQLKNAKTRVDMMGSLAQSVILNPNSYASAKSTAEQMGLIQAGMLPERLTPDLMPQLETWANQAMQVKDILEEERKRRGQTGTETDKYIQDWLATKKLADTPENRQKAREQYIKETKIEPARVRLEVLGETRGIPVTDKKTGETVYMSWSEYNKARKAEPDRYTAPQYDPETQMRLAAWRDLAKGVTRNQVTSYDTFLRHTGDLWDAVDTFSRTGSPWINSPLNALRRQGGGNPQIQAFLAKLDPVQKEFQSFLLNNRALYEDDRRIAQQMLNENLTSQQMRAVLSSIAHTGDARLQALNESFKRATGEDIPALYSEPAKQVLQKLGVQSPMAGAGAGGQQFQQTATDAQGNKVGWDGTKWVPIGKQ
jgi:hypothetical protein